MLKVNENIKIYSRILETKHGKMFQRPIRQKRNNFRSEAKRICRRKKREGPDKNLEILKKN